MSFEHCHCRAVYAYMFWHIINLSQVLPLGACEQTGYHLRAVLPLAHASEVEADDREHTPWLCGKQPPSVQETSSDQVPPCMAANP